MGAGPVLTALVLLVGLIATACGSDRVTTAGAVPARPAHVSPAPTVRPIGGKGTIDAIGIASSSTWVVGASASSPDGTVRYWLDRTTDGGRTWRVGPSSSDPDGVAAASSITFVNQPDGWAYSTIGSGLEWTDDGGRTWTRQDPTLRIAGLAGTGGSTWVVARGCASSACPWHVDVAASGRNRLRPLSAQPPLPPTGAFTLVRTSTAAADVLVTTDRGTGFLEVTADRGHSWTRRNLPCRSRQYAAGIAGAGRTLWVGCVDTYDLDPFTTADIVYRSDNGARTWRRSSPQSASAADLLGLPAFAVVSAQVGWDLQLDRSGTGAVRRTTDGGRTWTTVLANPPGPVRFSITALVAPSPTSAWATAVEPVGARRVLAVVHTVDGGKHWSASYPPPP